MNFEHRRSFALDAALVGLGLLLAANVGCSTSCSDPDDGPAEHIEMAATEARDFYESAPWDGTYLKFGPQKRYRFFHNLSGVPVTIQAWVGFNPRPVSKDHNVSEAVGNMAILQCVNERFFQLKNDTCETFYLRAVASNPRAVAEAGGAGSEDCVD